MMAVKFKIDFQIDAETLFGLISKFLPLENLHVEEVVERHAPAPKLAHQPKLAPKPKRAPRRSGYATNLEAGVNAVIMGVLADGEPHRFSELQHAIRAAGFARTGLGSRIKRLQEHGIVVRHSPGFYVKGKTL